jgi:hypothetical protein
MRLILLRSMTAALLFFAGAGTALACHIEGQVVCVPLGNPVEATVTVTGVDFTFTNSTTTDPETGRYYLDLTARCLNQPTTFSVTVQVGQGSVVEATTQQFTLEPGSVSTVTRTIDWTVSGVPGCGTTALGCWLTGGGAKFSPEAGIYVAERTPKVNFGGNVNPSCSPLPGDGGQWTHIDKGAKLFFQGQHIVVDDCGNISGIPPGSTSPVTPYNFIDFSGTGRLKSIAGNPNKVDMDGVCFVARAEDRNEPGSTGMRDGAGKDRYYIRVFQGVGGDCTNPGTTLLVLEANPGGTDRTDTVAITDGNLQLHISSCP